MRLKALGWLLAPLLAQAGIAQAPADFDAEGYRTARYRAPVTREAHPAPRIALAAAVTLRPGRDALFLDVMPVEGGTRDPATGRWRLSQQHETIPGAIWHPETGRAPVDLVLWNGLEAAVVKARRHAPGLPLIVFCRADCWMSWNAARRLAAAGHGGIWWLAEGTDGWHAQGLSLERATPAIIPAPISR